MYNRFHTLQVAGTSGEQYLLTKRFREAVTTVPDIWSGGLSSSHVNLRSQVTAFFLLGHGDKVIQ